MLHREQTPAAPTSRVNVHTGRLGNMKLDLLKCVLSRRQFVYNNSAWGRSVSNTVDVANCT